MTWLQANEADQLLAGQRNGFLVFRDGQQALENEFWESCQRSKRPVIQVRLDVTLPPEDRSKSTRTHSAVCVSIDLITTKDLHLSEIQQKEFQLMAVRFGASSYQLGSTLCVMFLQETRAAELVAQRLVA